MPTLTILGVTTTPSTSNSALFSFSFPLSLPLPLSSISISTRLLSLLNRFSSSTLCCRNESGEEGCTIGESTMW